MGAQTKKANIGVAVNKEPKKLVYMLVPLEFKANISKIQGKRGCEGRKWEKYERGGSEYFYNILRESSWGGTNGTRISN